MRYVEKKLRNVESEKDRHIEVKGKKIHVRLLR